MKNMKRVEGGQWTKGRPLQLYEVLRLAYVCSAKV